MRNNQMMCGVDGNLDIVANDTSAAAANRDPLARSAGQRIKIKDGPFSDRRVDLAQ
jgi:hypothetical protein